MRPFVCLVIAIMGVMAFTSCEKSEIEYYEKISLSVGASVDLMVGEQYSVDISQGSGKFEITTDCPRLSAKLANGKIMLEAVEEGNACCYIYDVRTREERLLKVNVSSVANTTRIKK